ncbi:hypothetical protein AX16_008564, partial [Volvariella volvacea WC 439]
VFLPALVENVPDNMICALRYFLNFCYLARRSVFTEKTLDSMERCLAQFHKYRKVFRVVGVQPTGFSLPRQHSLVHYRWLIEQYGAPNGLCSSITESRHITAVKQPWHRSNHFNSLSQMLLTNQCLDKLMALQNHLVDHGLLPLSHSLPQTMVSTGEDDNDNDEGLTDDVVAGNVVLAQKRVMHLPQDINQLAIVLELPHLPVLLQRFLYNQQSIGPRYDCAYVVEDQEEVGFRGMNVIQVLCFFSFTYDRILYPCAYVRWFKKVSTIPDRLLGLWQVKVERLNARGGGDEVHSIVHLDSMLRAAHLIPNFGSSRIPVNFSYQSTLSTFENFFINSYIDHHSHELISYSSV